MALNSPTHTLLELNLPCTSTANLSIIDDALYPQSHQVKTVSKLYPISNPILFSQIITPDALSQSQTGQVAMVLFSFVSTNCKMST
ncbi:hypothetical protein RRG08_012348 [Elysia crispata]|uniref:Uncharacterized protein n=1 Tax=Elysia crispata TaxID=231223 RepID=A0AAE1ABP4_9GAST|nr:hypothetical protein RRG08_012348 [Elysia crispata]